MGPAGQRLYFPDHERIGKDPPEKSRGIGAVGDERANCLPRDSAGRDHSIRCRKSQAVLDRVTKAITAMGHRLARITDAGTSFKKIPFTITM